MGTGTSNTRAAKSKPTCLPTRSSSATGPAHSTPNRCPPSISARRWRSRQNTGQTDEAVDFLSRGDGYSVFLTDGDAVMVLSGSESQHVVRLDLVDANTDLNVAGQDQLASNSNYLIGNDESNWQTDVDNFASVYYEDVYDGIDLRYYGNQRQLEYDFVVAAGTDPNAIRLSFDGIVDAEITETGELRLILNEQGDDDLFQGPDQLSDRRRRLADPRSRAPMSSTTTAASVSRWATTTAAASW